MHVVRTTVTLDEDVSAMLRAVARERGVSFKEALNDAVRAGLARSTRTRRAYRLPARAMGFRPTANLDQALRLADEIEDAELVRKLELRK